MARHFTPALQDAVEQLTPAVQGAVQQLFPTPWCPISGVFASVLTILISAEFNAIALPFRNVPLWWIWDSVFFAAFCLLASNPFEVFYHCCCFLLWRVLTSISHLAAADFTFFLLFHGSSFKTFCTSLGLHSFVVAVVPVVLGIFLNGVLLCTGLYLLLYYSMVVPTQILHRHGIISLHYSIITLILL